MRLKRQDYYASSIPHSLRASPYLPNTSLLLSSSISFPSTTHSTRLPVCRLPRIFLPCLFSAAAISVLTMHLPLTTMVSAMKDRLQTWYIPPAGLPLPQISAPDVPMRDISLACLPASRASQRLPLLLMSVDASAEKTLQPWDFPIIFHHCCLKQLFFALVSRKEETSLQTKTSETGIFWFKHGAFGNNYSCMECFVQRMFYILLISSCSLWRIRGVEILSVHLFLCEVQWTRMTLQTKWSSGKTHLHHQRVASKELS